MNNMPAKLREELSSDDEYKVCLRHHEGECSGRITFEHAEIYQGRQIQRRWAILPLCVYHHLGSGLNKRMNHWFAVNRMTAQDEQEFPRVDWERERFLLNKIFK